MAKVFFSSEAISELHGDLGPRADAIIRTLELVVAAYPDAKQFVEHHLQRQREEAFGELRALLNALQSAQRYFASADPDERLPWVADMEHLEEQVTLHLAATQRVFEVPDPSRRGRPRSESRRWLANYVAYVLQHYEVHITKTRDGIFHDVLRLVVAAAEGQEVDEMMPLVRETVDLFRTYTPEQLQQLDKLDSRLIGLLRRYPTA